MIPKVVYIKKLTSHNLHKDNSFHDTKYKTALAVSGSEIFIY